MKCFIVRLPKPVAYKEVRCVSEKVDPVSIITMIDSNTVYEFQNEVGAEKVAKVFGGKIEMFDVLDNRN